jgi:hypothetical protein
MRTRNIFRARNFVLGVLLVSVTASAPQQAPAQNAPESMSMPAFAPPMLEHMRKMRRYKDHDHGAQPTPHVIDRFTVDSDPKGAIASFQPNGATFTANNAFFKDMGTNGRTCFTGHQPQNGWGVSAKDVAERFQRTAGTDLPTGRRFNLPQRRRINPVRKETRLQIADRKRSDPRRLCRPCDGRIRRHGN